MPFQPLQFGIPGGPELFVILLMTLMMGIPILIIVLAVVGAAKLMGGSDDEHVRELEQRVARLEGQLEGLDESTADVEATREEPEEEDDDDVDTDEGSQEPTE